MKNFFKTLIRVGQRIIDQPWFYPIVLLLAGLSAYGIIFTRPGFFWDDWTFVYFYKLKESAALSLHYLPSRPFTGWLYFVLFTFTKMTPIAWEFAALIIRWLGILFIYFTLNAIWPTRVWQNKWVGVLMFVFPGFLSQPASVGYSQHFSTFLLFACSLFLTVLAIKQQKLFWFWMPLSVVLGVAQMFITEFFVALEIIRVPIIWFAIQSQQQKKNALLRTFLYWLPFALGLGVFFWERFIFLPPIILSEPNSVELIKTILRSPISGLSKLIGMAYTDIGHLLISVWAGTFAFDKFNLTSSRLVRIFLLLGIVEAVLVGLHIRRSSRDENATEQRTLGQMLILGSVALLAGAIPVWAIDMHIAGGKWSDRFTLGPMLGAVILVIYLLDWLFRTRNQKQWLLIILLASSIALQVTNTNQYRMDWVIQQNLYWQLSWRIPNLKPGTAIIGSGTFTEKSSLYDGGYIVNLLFSSQFGANAQYDYFDIWHAPPSGYLPNVSLDDRMQGSRFSGNTSQAIGMYFNGSSTNECMRILDPIYTGDPRFIAKVNKIIPISNPNEITVGDGSRVPDPAIFGKEPLHSWCYYFEKADLARQMKDWKTVLLLGAEAESKNFAPTSGGEYLPFIEAYAQTGQWSKANDLSMAAQKITPGLEPALCNNWQNYQQISGGIDRDTYLAKAKAEFCSDATP